jgi:hypothetical protein
MRSLPVALLIPLALVLTNCAGTKPAPSTNNEAYTAERLVDELPAGVEGVELAKDGLRPKKGYSFVKDSDSTVAVMRMSDGSVVGGSHCSCWVGVGCIPDLNSDIVTCMALPIGCIRCGLVLTYGDIRTEVFQYTKKE